MLLRNNVGQKHAWVGFELPGKKSLRDAIGAKITVEAEKRKLVRWITGGVLFSSHDKRVVVGIPDLSLNTVDAEIRWPSGTLQRLSNLELKQYHHVLKPSEKR